MSIIETGDNMVLSYKELTMRGFSDYKIKKMIAEEKLFFIKKGMYSTLKNFDYLEYITKKHPNVIVTLESACYCYGLLRKPRSYYRVATKQKDRKIKDDFVKQIFMTDSLYNVGVNVITYKGFKIKIYDLERTLVEVARNKIMLSYDDYQEIMSSYRKLTRLINKEKLYSYISCFKDKRIEMRINRELGI